jgi:hypothetical protein
VDGNSQQRFVEGSAPHSRRLNGQVPKSNVLHVDLLAIDPGDILKTEVLMTVVGGRIVYEHPERR